MSLTQKQLILNYLNKHGSINRVEAINRLRVYNLPARISELRDEGHKITAEHRKLRGGKLSKDVRYRFEQGEKQNE